MKPGDSVRFVGDPKDYVSSARGILKRKGIVASFSTGAGLNERIGVYWIPKTKRGSREYLSIRTRDIALVEGDANAK